VTPFRGGLRTRIRDGAGAHEGAGGREQHHRRRRVPQPDDPPRKRHSADVRPRVLHKAQHPADLRHQLLLPAGGHPTRLPHAGIPQLAAHQGQGGAGQVVSQILPWSSQER